MSPRPLCDNHPLAMLGTTSQGALAWQRTITATVVAIDNKVAIHSVEGENELDVLVAR